MSTVWCAFLALLSLSWSHCIKFRSLVQCILKADLLWADVLNRTSHFMMYKSNTQHQHWNEIATLSWRDSSFSSAVRAEPWQINQSIIQSIIQSIKNIISRNYIFEILNIFLFSFIICSQSSVCVLSIVLLFVISRYQIQVTGAMYS